MKVLRIFLAALLLLAVAGALGVAFLVRKGLRVVSASAGLDRTQFVIQLLSPH
jgi:hypothetical protein